MLHSSGVRNRSSQTFGYPAPWRGEYGRLLKERYGVQLNPVAGCCVTDSLVEYVRGYNEVSCRLFSKKYGRDISAECLNEAQRKWGEGHPEQ